MRLKTDSRCSVSDGENASGTFFERSFNSTAKKILPGEYYVTNGETMIATLLGSCVSVCLYDRVNKIGGMNHFMLPGSTEPPNTESPSPRYGAHAMDRLFQELFLLGANPDNLEAKVVGAGRVIGGMQDIGKRNAEFALCYLQKRNVKVAAVEVGDVYARKVLFAPATGQLFVKQLRDHPYPVQVKQED